MNLNTTIGVIIDVNDYLSRSSEKRLQIFNVFNYAMVEDGWLDDIAKQIMV